MARKGSITRKQSRQLAQLARRGKKQIAQDEVKLVKEERQAFLEKSLKDRLKYFYNNNIPTKKGKRTLWFLLPVIIPMMLVYTVIQILKLDIAWAWSKQLFFVVKK